LIIFPVQESCEKVTVQKEKCTERVTDDGTNNQKDRNEKDENVDKDGKHDEIVEDKNSYVISVDKFLGKSTCIFSNLSQMHLIYYFY